MSKEFKREERYIVIKLKSLNKQKLDWLRGLIRMNDLPTVEKAVVVESDWPEYEPTWAAIERRVTGAPAWVGIGPPPSGTVCELRNVAAGTEWAEATIVFASRNVVVWDWVGEPPINGLCTAYAHAVEMRPIRTPEQIAEEEARARIIKFAADIKEAGWESPEMLAHYLDGHGYRKQVAP